MERPGSRMRVSPAPFTAPLIVSTRSLGDGITSPLHTAARGQVHGPVPPASYITVLAQRKQLPSAPEWLHGFGRSVLNESCPNG